MRVVFHEVSLTGRKSVKCACGCGKTIIRQKKFSQTVSPFNTKAAGVPKTPKDIGVDLRRAIELWQVTAEYVAGHEPILAKADPS